MLGVFDLPAPLLVELLADWLDVTSLLHLDSACCSVVSRKVYLEVVESGEFCLQFAPSPGFREPGSMEWFVSRKVKTKRFYIDGMLVLSDQIVARLLDGTGALLEFLQCYRCWCTPSTKAVFEPVGQVFSRLIVLKMEHCGTPTETISLGPLLQASAASLKRLTLERCHLNDSFESTFLPDLEVLHFNIGSIKQSSLCRLISASPSLRSFACDSLRSAVDSDDCLDALAAHCPHLQILYYGMGSATDVTSLVRLLHSCPDLEVVDVLAHPDDPSRSLEMAAVVQLCARLKALCASGCTYHTTDETQHVAVAVRARDLVHLRWCYCDFETDTPVQALAANCANLRSLELNLFSSMVSQVALIALVSNLSSVVELALHNCDLSNSVFSAVAAHCPRLEAFHLTYSKHHTALGIAALVHDCAALRRVYVMEDDPVVTSLSRLLWTALRPEIRFVFGYQLGAMWVALQDVERDELVVW